MEFRELSVSEYKQIIEKTSFLFTQSPEYGQLQEERGIEVKRFVAEKDGQPILAFQFFKYFLTENLSFGLIPHGPVFFRQDIDVLKLQKALKNIAKEENLIFLRFNPYPILAQKEEDNFAKHFTKAHSATYSSPVFQPRREWWIDLKNSEKDLLANMHKKTRYNIRKAKRGGVRIEVIDEGLSDCFNDFYALLKETAQRGGFSLHPRKYYEKMFSCNFEKPTFVLFVAKHKDKILAASLVEITSKVSTFLYTGISQKGLKMRTSGLLRFETIKYLKEKGFKYASFGGVAKDDKNNSWSGFSDFKKRFGGFEVLHTPYFDLINKRFWYFLYLLRKIIRYKFK